jgi:serine phosphatase RsbU (regulator of sigma subunit)/PAS domain-containing protein
VPDQHPRRLPSQRAEAARLLPVGGHSAAVSRLTGLASRLLSGPGFEISTQVSLLTEVQTIAAGTGLQEGVLGSATPVADSLCSVTAASGGPLIVGRAPLDDRVSTLAPVVSGAVGAYLGVPLEAHGVVVGALCAFGPQERAWTATDVDLLQELAGAVVAQLELEALSTDYAASRLRWDLAVDAAGIGTFEWDLDSKLLHWDERVQALFGFGPGEFGSRVDEGFERVHAEDRPALEAAVAAAIADGSDLRAEYRVVWPDQQVRWVFARGRALKDEGSFLGTVQDVTEIRTARDEAARLLERMATGFLSVDHDWRIAYANQAGARVLGATSEALVGQLLWDAFPGLEDSEFGRQYKAVVETGKPANFEAHYAHLDAWFEVRAEADLHGLALYFLDVTDRQNDRRLAQEATDRLELLARVSAELAEAGLHTEGAIARLSELLVPQLADWCVVSLLEDGRLRDVGCWHHDPALRPVLDDYVANRLIGRSHPGPVQQVRETGRPLVQASGVLEQVLPTLGSDLAKDALRQLDPQSFVVVPLTARDSLTGTLSLLRAGGRPPMTKAEIITAQEIALRAGLALDNARLYARQRSLAEELQRSLLTTPPEPDHCQIVVRYAPAAEEAKVGGDWFDSFLQQDGATVLVIGDVMGHDTAAAAAMGQLRGLLRGIAWHSGAAPADVLCGLDAAMEGLLVTTTASAVVARLEQSDDELERGVTRLRWSNAGHPPPMLIHPDGQVQPLVNLDSELLLGIDSGTSRTDTVTVVDRGATLLLYTDGLVERRGQDLDAGLALLRTTLTELADLELDDLCDQLLARMQPAKPEDDVALVAVRLHRQDRPRPAEAGPQRVPPNVG